MLSRLHTFPIHPDRQITLEDYSLRAGIISRLLELLMEQELEVVSKS